MIASPEALIDDPPLKECGFFVDVDQGETVTFRYPGVLSVLGLFIVAADPRAIVGKHNRDVFKASLATAADRGHGRS